MIELRYIHVEGSDNRSLQYRWSRKLDKGQLSEEWSNWKFVPRIIVDMEYYEELQKESIGNG